MRHRTQAHLIAALAIVLGLAAPASAAETILLKSGTLSLDGKSTLHAFTASTTDIRIQTSLDPDAVVNAAAWERVLQPSAVKSFTVEIPVATLKSEKNGLNKNMYKALKSDQYPTIALMVARYEIGEARDGVTPVKVVGTLTVAGVERPVELTLDTRVTPEGLAVAGRQELLMTDFGIKPPSFMLGTLKTDNHIAIRFSLVLALSNS